MLDDFDIRPCGDDDDNSNASNKSLKVDDKEFEMELENENILENEHGISDNKVKADYFVNDEEESNVDLDDNKK